LDSIGEKANIIAMQALGSERFTATIKQVHEKSKTEFLNNELEFLKGRDNNKLMLKSD
jgi:hypothetical protein